MRDQLAAGTDVDVRTDNAIRTDRGALADHSAIFNPRRGIDRTHRSLINRSALRRRPPRPPLCRLLWRRRETTTWSFACQCCACDIRWYRRASPVYETY